MIVQGTTPVHGFQNPFNDGDIKIARFVYSQNGKVVCAKTGEAVRITPESITTKLTQEETYQFAPDTRVKLVLRVLTASGDALQTEPVFLSCLGCDCKEVLQ